MVNALLYCAASRILPSGVASCVRTTSARRPPTMKKKKVVYRYMIPIFL